MTPSSTFKLASAALSVALLASVAPTVAYADDYGYNNSGRLTIYFTRHAEKQTVTADASDAPDAPDEAGDPPVYTSDGTGLVISLDQSGTSEGSRLDEVCGTSKCAEELNKKGTMRAMLLADWMGSRGITGKIDAVYATHKTRTQQTVTPLAIAAGKMVENVMTDYLEFGDTEYGDTELNPESTTPSECATLQAIEASMEAGHDTIAIAGHSGTLYDIMGSGVTSDCILKSDALLNGLGLDTSDEDRFPKDDDGKVAKFGDLWKVVIRPNGKAVFKYRKQLDFLKLGVVENAR